jgi:hypothetical protein
MSLDLSTELQNESITQENKAREDRELAAFYRGQAEERARTYAAGAQEMGLNEQQAGGLAADAARAKAHAESDAQPLDRMANVRTIWYAVAGAGRPLYFEGDYSQPEWQKLHAELVRLRSACAAAGRITNTIPPEVLQQNVEVRKALGMQ